ncbi:SPOR domain-containing protein [Sphingomonas sp. AOB5]|nr:SPOR domain-containing protein [Sphingomonas sp. AOB5]MDF7774376.1 SPOR domain-containing protein [Sphingomonas sp. AOB5]
MKTIWLAAAAGAALSMSPAMAQTAPDEPVKAGVDAWERGDYKAAVERWRPEAVRGNPDAQFNLGQAYKLGRGVPIDLNQAEEWYRKAAVQGHPQAQDNYGLALFQNGKRPQAVEWLQRSATRGEPRTQFVLGTMYFNGDAVERDWVRAYALTVRASQSGLPQASTALAQMDRYISLSERQQGLTLARQYEESANRPQPTTDYASNIPPATRPPVATTTRPPRTTPAPRPTPPAPKPTEVAAAPGPVRDGGWRLQLGAFGDPNNARKLWSQVGSRFPGRQVYYVKQGSLTRVLVGPFASRAEAASGCRGVSPCVPVSK